MLASLGTQQLAQYLEQREWRCVGALATLAGFGALFVALVGVRLISEVAVVGTKMDHQSCRSGL